MANTVTIEECKNRHGWMKWGFSAVLLILTAITSALTWNINSVSSYARDTNDTSRKNMESVQELKLSLETHIAVQIEHDRHIVEKLEEIRKCMVKYQEEYEKRDK